MHISHIFYLTTKSWWKVTCFIFSTKPIPAVSVASALQHWAVPQTRLSLQQATPSPAEGGMGDPLTPPWLYPLEMRVVWVVWAQRWHLLERVLQHPVKKRGGLRMPPHLVPCMKPAVFAVQGSTLSCPHSKCVCRNDRGVMGEGGDVFMSSLSDCSFSSSCLESWPVLHHGWSAGCVVRHSFSPGLWQRFSWPGTCPQTEASCCPCFLPLSSQRSISTCFQTLGAPSRAITLVLRK